MHERYGARLRTVVVRQRHDILHDERISTWSLLPHLQFSYSFAVGNRADESGLLEAVDDWVLIRLAGVCLIGVSAFFKTEYFIEFLKA